MTPRSEGTGAPRRTAPPPACDARACEHLYVPCMKHVRALFERLRGGRRPPTGPLTTVEKTTADELRTQTSLKDSERGKHEHEREE